MLEFLNNHQDWYVGFSFIFGVAGALNFAKLEDGIPKTILTAIIYGLIWPIAVASRLLGDE